MTLPRILYVCGRCWEYASEQCGWCERDELRVMPDGTWLCNGCYDDERAEETPDWRDLPVPPEYSVAAPELLEALRAAEGLAVCCMAVDCYSRDELAKMARATLPTFRATIATAREG